MFNGFGPKFEQAIGQRGGIAVDDLATQDLVTDRQQGGSNGAGRRRRRHLFSTVERLAWSVNSSPMPQKSVCYEGFPQGLGMGFRLCSPANIRISGLFWVEPAPRGGDAQRIAYAFRRCLTREPTKSETKTLTKFVKRQRDRVKKGSLDASEISAVSSEELSGDKAEHAVWTLLARVLLNLDETIVRQ